MRREEAIVTAEVDGGPKRHRRREDAHPKTPSPDSGHRFGEEHPHMRALTGTRDLCERIHAGAFAFGDIGRGIRLPFAVVEIAGEKQAFVVLEHRVQPGVEPRSAETPVDGLLVEGEEIGG